MFFEWFLGLFLVVLALLGCAISGIVRQNVIFRRHYKKFANVWTSAQTSLLRGDVPEITRNYLSKGVQRAVLATYLFLKDPSKDFVFLNFLEPTLYPCSAEAIGECISKIPSHMDRGYKRNFMLGIVRSSVFLSRSTSRWKHRRRVATTSLQFNRSSQYVPMIQEKARQHTERWVKSGEIEFPPAASDLTFSVITRVIFGTDLQLERSFSYEDKAGAIHAVTLHEMLVSCVRDAARATLSPLNLLSTVFERLNVGSETRRCKRNNARLHSGICEVLKKDEGAGDSVFKQIKDSYPDYRQLADDLFVLLFAGHDTSAHALTAAIFRALKHPEERAKVQKELDTLLEGRSLSDITLAEIQELTYFG